VVLAPLRAPGRVGGEEITIYKSLGRGIQDLVVARHLLGAS
jgi:ornithine cyclodeaminase/alanine dehydrogenase-like protein (mu-crystallin family)